MNLSNLQPATGSTHNQNKRLGRGQGSGKGGTASRGHKGAKSRSGYSKKIGFEGGQMPFHRRVPKSGFNSFMATKRAEIRLSQLNDIDADVIDILVLKSHDLIKNRIETVKVIATGEITKPVTLRGILATKGAKQAIEKAGGKVEE